MILLLHCCMSLFGFGTRVLLRFRVETSEPETSDLGDILYGASVRTVGARDQQSPRVRVVPVLAAASVDWLCSLFPEYHITGTWCIVPGTQYQVL